jgi:quercetin dioxygenase-like cupin family protein
VDVLRWEDVPVEQLSPMIGRQLLNTGRMTFARVLLAQGAVVPEHRHPHEQVATLLQGRLRFVVDGEELEVGPGELVSLAPDVPHAVEALEESVVLDVFAPVRDDWLRGDDAYLRGDE